MKQRIIFITLIVYTMIFLSCSDDENLSVAEPTAIENLKAVIDSGFITLYWSVPADSNFLYVQTSYTIDSLDENFQKQTSIYADSLVIDDLLNKYGDITFYLQTFNEDETESSEIYSITAQCLPSPTTISISDGEEVDLDDYQVYTDGYEASGEDGSIANLVDGDTDTYYHGVWWSGYDSQGNAVGVTDFPHYIVIDVGDPVNAFSFSYYTRNSENYNNAPSAMNVYSSTDFDGETYSPGYWSATLLDSLNSDDLPEGALEDYNSDIYVSLNTHYIWFEVSDNYLGNSYFALAELYIYKYSVSIYDPETGETNEYE